METLEGIRNKSEKQFKKELAALDLRTQAKILAALEQYGHPRDIPDWFWREIEQDHRDALLAAIALAMLNGDEWTANSLENQGLAKTNATAATYGAAASTRVGDSADVTTNTLRSRVTRSVEDSLASPRGGVGSLSATAARAAVKKVLNRSRREAIAISETTGALTTGQRGAAERMGGDGARTADGNSVQIEMRWRTEADNLVCPRCAPLEGTPEGVWGEVFPNGPGEEAHPNCRCWLEPVVVVQPNQELVTV